jgi:hypothetical protein
LTAETRFYTFSFTLKNLELAPTTPP